jgi:hypothetical protein
MRNTRGLSLNGQRRSAPEKDRSARLELNEPPWPPSSVLLDPARDALNDIHRYPSLDAADLRNAISVAEMVRTDAPIGPAGTPGRRDLSQPARTGGCPRCPGARITRGSGKKKIVSARWIRDRRLVDPLQAQGISGDAAIVGCVIVAFSRL